MYRRLVFFFVFFLFYGHQVRAWGFESKLLEFQFSNGSYLVFDLRDKNANQHYVEFIRPGMSHKIIGTGPVSVMPSLSSSKNGFQKGTIYIPQRQNLGPEFLVSQIDGMVNVVFEMGTTITLNSNQQLEVESMSLAHANYSRISWVAISIKPKSPDGFEGLFLLNSIGAFVRLSDRYVNLDLLKDEHKISPFTDKGVFRFVKDNHIVNIELNSIDLQPERTLITPYELVKKKNDRRTAVEVQNVVRGEVHKNVFESHPGYSVYWGNQNLNQYPMDDQESKGNFPVPATSTSTTNQSIPDFVRNYHEIVSQSGELLDVDLEIKMDVYEALARASGVAILSPGKVGVDDVIKSIAADVFYGRSPRMFRDFEFLYFSSVDIDTNTKYRGEFDEKVKAIIDYSIAHPKTIWIVDSMADLIDSGKAQNSHSGFYDKIKDRIADGTIRMIGLEDIDLYYNFMTDSQLARNFEVVKLNTLEEWEDIETRVVSYFEKKWNLDFSKDLLLEAHKLVSLGDVTGFEPQRTIKFLEGVVAAFLVREQNPNQIQIADLHRFAIKKYGFDPEEFSLDAAREKLSHLREHLESNIIGQPDMIKAVVQGAKLTYTGTLDPGKARLGVLLTGDRGLGKTEIAYQYGKALGRPVFRLAMGEYSTAEAGVLERLKYDIYKQLSKNPYSVLFFDEMDKAPMFIQNGLLALFDGKTFMVRESFSRGGTGGRYVHADISRADIIFGSNAGVEYLRNSMGGAKSGSIGFIQSLEKEKKVDSLSFEKFLSEGKELSPYIVSRINTIAVAQYPTEESFATALNYHIDKTIKEIENRAKIKVRMTKVTLKNLVNALAEKFFYEHRDYRVQGIINQFVREPISEARLVPGTGEQYLYKMRRGDLNSIHLIEDAGKTKVGGHKLNLVCRFIFR